MPLMTSQERFRRMFAHQEAGRVPIIDRIVALAKQLGSYK